MSEKRYCFSLQKIKICNKYMKEFNICQSIFQ